MKKLILSLLLSSIVMTGYAYKITTWVKSVELQENEKGKEVNYCYTLLVVVTDDQGEFLASGETHIAGVDEGCPLGSSKTFDSGDQNINAFLESAEAQQTINDAIQIYNLKSDWTSLKISPEIKVYKYIVSFKTQETGVFRIRVAKTPGSVSNEFYKAIEVSSPGHQEIVLDLEYSGEANEQEDFFVTVLGPTEVYRGQIKED